MKAKEKVVKILCGMVFEEDSWKDVFGNEIHFYRKDLSSIAAHKSYSFIEVHPNPDAPNRWIATYNGNFKGTFGYSDTNAGMYRTGRSPADALRNLFKAMLKELVKQEQIIDSIRQVAKHDPSA